jgi:feruloyl-CoA synthase
MLTSLAIHTLFARPGVLQLEATPDRILLRSPYALGGYPRSLNVYLDRWANDTPDALFLAERVDEKWRGVTFAEALTTSRRLAACLMALASAECPVAILSDNSIEHALLMLGAMRVGIPAMSISPAYSLASKDHGKLKSIVARTTPGVIYVDDAERYKSALQAVQSLHSATIMVGARSVAAPKSALSFNEAVQRGTDSQLVESARQAFEQVTPDTIAKLLFTSGSTDEPKAVINTHRMLCSNQQAKAQLWPFLEKTPPIILDWLPWNHTFGGNHNFNMVLRNGGTMYIDDGRPTPALFEKSIRNICEVEPNLYFNVPRGYELLVPALRKNATLRKHFFSRLQLTFYAAAALPKHLWDEMIELSSRARGRPVPMLTSWGATETGPLATDCHFQADRPGVIGLPVPGCTIKLVRRDSKYEARVAGPQVTPGYWRRGDLDKLNFDEEGFYLSGDAFCFVDPKDPAKGLLFDGRIAEDFKLTTGTWVSVGSLRLRAVSALAPLAQDIVVVGHDRSELGLLIFPNFDACADLCGGQHFDGNLTQLLSDERVRQQVKRGLDDLRRRNPASSMHATRAILLPEVPSIDGGEITDKGYINQRRALTLRHQYIEQLYENRPGCSIVTLAED